MVRTEGYQDDRLLVESRWLAIFIIPFLVVAFVLLYFFPNDTDKHFAWTIKPAMTPMMLGAAYLGGTYFFARVALTRRWHTVKVGFLPVLAFASLLGIATILHWDRFNHNHISFFTWAALYFTTPFAVFAVWRRNRSTDPGDVAPDDAIIPDSVRWFSGVVGTATLAVSVLLFLLPGLMISLWPWMLTPLTARVVGAMFALPGLVGLGLAVERRWSAARIILEAQSISIVLILIAAARAWGDFDQSKPATWLFIGGLSALFLAIACLYVRTQGRRRGAKLGLSS